MPTADDKFCKHFHMLELKQSFVKAIGQQVPAIQQFEEIVCLFSKHTTPLKQLELRISAQHVHLLLQYGPVAGNATEKLLHLLSFCSAVSTVHSVAA